MLTAYCADTLIWCLKKKKRSDFKYSPRQKEKSQLDSCSHCSSKEEPVGQNFAWFHPHLTGSVDFKNMPLMGQRLSIVAPQGHSQQDKLHIWSESQNLKIEAVDQWTLKADKPCPQKF